MSSKALVALLCVLLGCCASVVFLELLVLADPGSGNLITFCQFVVISMEGFVTTMRFGTRKLAVPIREYIVLVVLFFMVSTMNNMAFNFNISMTLHLIFRAGSLMTSMVLGVLIMNKKYTVTKYASVVTISIGIAICTVASAKDVKTSHALHGGSGFSDYFWWVVGITILTLALFMSARMGLYQEVMYRKYGKHPREALFFTHFLPLPGFALLLSDLVTHIDIANKSVPLQVFGVTMPAIWLYITCNVLTQCVCINSVFVLTTECTSLTVTLVITLRKFLSLIFSIFYFNNPFTLLHWLGTILVFTGTFIYSDIPSMLRQRSSGDKLKIT